MQSSGCKPGFVARSVAVVALPVAGCALAHFRPSLWETLNGLWLLFAAAVLAHWVFGDDRKGSRWPMLVSLTVLLVLLFPIFSPDDDWLLFSLPDEARTAVSVPEKQKQLGAAARPHVATIATMSLFPSFNGVFELAPGIPTDFPAAPAGHATGNHSPPTA